jgi:CRISPR system Cascade subunit CasD
MSSDKRFLSLHLTGPLQSWGFDSQYNRRNTGLMPTKSAIAGMCCAALGLSRGSNKEQEFLSSFSTVRMTAIAIPRKGTKKELPVRRLQDYQTVKKTRRASGAINNDCVLTHRQYLTDSEFGVLLEGNAILLCEIANALADPKWGIWLGRKTCIPSAPIFAGLKDNEKDAVRLLIGEESIKSYTRQEDANNFTKGCDSLTDTPLSFAINRRLFSPRRVQTTQKEMFFDVTGL